eukprot:2638470-Prymnesium_polylepis.1
MGMSVLSTGRPLVRGPDDALAASSRGRFCPGVSICPCWGCAQRVGWSPHGCSEFHITCVVTCHHG